MKKKQKVGERKKINPCVDVSTLGIVNDKKYKQIWGIREDRHQLKY